jgi:hypothetical protein
VGGGGGIGSKLKCEEASLSSGVIWSLPANCKEETLALAIQRWRAQEASAVGCGPEYPWLCVSRDQAPRVATPLLILY